MGQIIKWTKVKNNNIAKLLRHFDIMTTCPLQQPPNIPYPAPNIPKLPDRSNISPPQVADNRKPNLPGCRHNLRQPHLQETIPIRQLDQTGEFFKEKFVTITIKKRTLIDMSSVRPAPRSYSVPFGPGEDRERGVVYGFVVFWVYRVCVYIL